MGKMNWKERKQKKSINPFNTFFFVGVYKIRITNSCVKHSTNFPNLYYNVWDTLRTNKIVMNTLTKEVYLKITLKYKVVEYMVEYAECIASEKE